MENPLSMSGLGKQIPLLFLIAVLCVANVGLLIQNAQLRSKFESVRPSLIAPGDLIGTIVGKDLRGKNVEVDLATPGIAFFLYYFSPRCAYCEQLAPDMADFLTALDGSKVRAIAITIDKFPLSEVQEHVLDAGFQDRPVVLVESEIATTFKLAGTPLSIVVRDAQVVDVRVGPWQVEDRASLWAALAMRPPADEQVRLSPDAES